VKRAWLVAFGVAFGVSCHHAAPETMHPLAPAAYSHYLAGQLAEYRDDWATAANELAEAAAAAPDQPVFAVELARALDKAKRTNDALAVLAKARETWPDHSAVWLASGDLIADSDRAGAIAAYQRAIVLQPDDEHAYLGLEKLEGTDAIAAERTLRALIAHVPGSVDGHYHLAQRLRLGGDEAGAMAELRLVLERDPDQIDARLDLARLLRLHGKLDDSIAQTRSAFDRAGQPLDIAEELFWLLCEADDKQGAIDLLTLLDDDRSDVDALAMVERFDIELGRLVEAREVVGRIAAIDPEASTLARAELENATGDLGSNGEPLAVATALTVPPSSQKFVSARRIAGDALVSAGKPQRALEVIAPARQLKPDDLELAFVAAVATADAGSPRQAETLVAGTDVPHLLAQARLADHVHDTKGALATLVPLVRAHPRNVTALNLAGYLLADSKQRLDDAEAYLKAARELSPGDPAILDSWGWLLLQRGRTREAIRALDHAQRFAPREPEILLHLATAWAADHVPKTAADLLSRAVALHPTAEVQKRIDDLRKELVIR
jgi:tetratricopeptide (TPR) repeat protein